MSDYFHDVPGRLRVRIAALKANPSMGFPIQELLQNVRGTLTVSIRPTTGSVVIIYDPQLMDSKRILNLLAGKGFIEAGKISQVNSQLETILLRVFEEVLKAALSRAVNNALRNSLPSSISAIL